MDSLADEDSDTFCENINNFTGDLRGASKVLDACQKITTKSLLHLISEKFNLNIFFYNIDGNKSNFNTLAAELKGPYIKDVLKIWPLLDPPPPRPQVSQIPDPPGRPQF